MEKGRRTEGPRAPLFYSATVSLLLASAPALPQTLDIADLESCAELATPEQKLRCFEALIPGSNASRAAAVPTVVAEEAPPKAAPAPTASIESATPSVVPVTTTATIAQAAPEPTAVTATASSAAVTPEPAAAAGTAFNTSTTPQPVPVAAESPASTAASAEADRESAATASTTLAAAQVVGEFGQEQLEQREGPKEEADDVMRASVTEVTGGRSKALHFHLDNGQVWRQIEVRRFQYPKNTEFDVRITRGMMGDYRLRIGDKGRMVRIRRVQ